MQRIEAYMNHGRWIAECPRPYCGNAVLLQPRQPRFVCKGPGGCAMEAVVVWPGNADELTAELERRPVPATRNWFPKGHYLAERWRLPSGQSIKDLRSEFADYGGA